MSLSTSSYEPSLSSHQPGIRVEVIGPFERHIVLNETKEWKTMHGRDLIFTIEFRDKQNIKTSVTIKEPLAYYKFVAKSQDICACVQSYNVITHDVVQYVPVIVPKMPEGVISLSDVLIKDIEDSIHYAPIRRHKRKSRGPDSDLRRSRARILLAQSRRKQACFKK